MTFQFPAGVLAQHTAVLGKTGSGKTSTAKLMIEQVVADGARVCILDPLKSDWWGITSSADGKHAGLPFVILGGPHGHVPLHSSAGEAIGEVVANGTLPLSIIDMADFEGGGLQRFFVDFAETLYKRNKGVVYLVIEEAHEFAPKERSGIGAENMAIHWAKKLATGSRTKGIRLIVASQRTQALHNALIGSCDTMIAHRMTAPADQKPVLDWLKANAGKDAAQQVADSFSNIKTGSAYLASGEAKIFEFVTFPRIQTYDNTKTPDGKTAAQTAVNTAKVDITQLVAVIGEAVKEAKANDPEELKKEIAELKRLHREAEKRDAAYLAKREAAAAGPTQADLLAAQNSGYAQGLARGRERGIKDAFELVTGKIGEVARLHDEATTGLHGIAKELLAIPSGVPVDMPPLRETVKGFTPTKAPPVGAKIMMRPAPKSNGSAAAVKLPPGEHATLTALIQFPEGLARNQLTVLTQYKRSSRDAYIQRLREKGLVETNGDTVSATAAGAAAIPDAEPLPTGAELQEHWMRKLPSGEAKVLQVLIDAYPDTVSRDSLTESTGFARSSRDAYLQRMKAKQLWTEPSRGEVRASEDLF